MKRMLYFVVAALLCVPALAAEAKPGPCPEWKHTKKYPIEVLKVLSPTEFQIKLLEDGKTYRFRLAHVEPFSKSKKMPKDAQNSDDGKRTFYDYSLQISQYFISNDKPNEKPAKQGEARSTNMRGPFEYWIEFEEDSIQSDSSAILYGYLFSTEKKPYDYPLNFTLLSYTIPHSGRMSTYFQLSTYQKEKYGDSKGIVLLNYLQKK